MSNASKSQRRCNALWMGFHTGGIYDTGVAVRCKVKIRTVSTVLQLQQRQGVSALCVVRRVEFDRCYRNYSTHWHTICWDTYNTVLQLQAETHSFHHTHTHHKQFNWHARLCFFLPVFVCKSESPSGSRNQGFHHRIHKQATTLFYRKGFTGAGVHSCQTYRSLNEWSDTIWCNIKKCVTCSTRPVCFTLQHGITPSLFALC